MLKCFYDQNFDCPFLFSSAKVEVINNYLVKFQVKSSNGKTTYFKRKVQVCFAAIILIQKVAENHVKIWN